MEKQQMILMTPVLWDKAMASLRANLGKEVFDAWMSTLALEEYEVDNNRVILSVPTRFYQRRLERRYLAEIQDALSQVLEVSVSVDIVVNEDDSKTPDRDARPAAGSNGTGSHRQLTLLGSTEVEPVRRGASPDRKSSSGSPSRLERISVTTPSAPPVGRPESPRLNPRYLFDEFVVGESNRYAHAAAMAVAEPKSKAFNPLFIYGGSGLGKTHLMQAIGHRMHQMDPRLHIVYVTSEQFINSFIDSIQNRRHMEFRGQFRNVDLLLVDDVQFLMGKERTQQEFFHTFNALYDAGKKVVVTSDRPPRDLSTLEDRLKSRFEWGLLVDIQTPDLETRIAILRKKAEAEGIRLSQDVILFIAEHVTTNIREMEGALKKLRMAASFHDRAIDLETARDILGHLMVGSPQPRVSVDDVQRAVCNYFGIKTGDLLGKNRSKKFTQPRHLAQYLCRKLTELSFPDIAQKFGGKDHTSIIYACRKVEMGMKKDGNMANVVAYLTRQITKGAE